MGLCETLLSAIDSQNVVNVDNVVLFALMKK